MIKKLIIIGSGGHGKVCLDIARSMNKWDKIYFLDDRKVGEKVNDAEVIDVIKNSDRYKTESEFFVAVGDNETREKILNGLIKNNYNIATLIHSSAIIGSDVTIDIGTVLMPGTIINASSHIGIGCIINTKVSVDHDCLIGNFVHISPGTTLCGTVFIGDDCWIGSNVTIVNNVTLCKEIIVGASSLILKSINKRGEYFGIPVRRIKGKGH